MCVVSGSGIFLTSPDLVGAFFCVLLSLDHTPYNGYMSWFERFTSGYSVEKEDLSPEEMHERVLDMVGRVNDEEYQVGNSDILSSEQFIDINPQEAADRTDLPVDIFEGARVLLETGSGRVVIEYEVEQYIDVSAGDGDD